MLGVSAEAVRTAVLQVLPMTFKEAVAAGAAIRGMSSRSFAGLAVSDVLATDPEVTDVVRLAGSVAVSMVNVVGLVQVYQSSPDAVPAIVAQDMSDALDGEEADDVIIVSWRYSITDAGHTTVDYTLEFSYVREVSPTNVPGLTPEVVRTAVQQLFP